MENGKKIRILTIRFNNEISAGEISLFRGAVNAAMGGEANILFHNHRDDSFRYSYPLIQYKRIGKQAAIICISSGTDVIGQFLAADSEVMMLGDREIRLEIDSIVPRQIMVQTWNSKFTYNLKRWLPLNSENYRTYQCLDSLTEKIELLEKILTGNLLSLAKGLEIKVTEQIFVKIKKIEEPYLLRNKNVKLMAFDLEFVTNMSIPNFVGLGKNASIGFGTVTQKTEKHRKEIDNIEQIDKE